VPEDLQLELRPAARWRGAVEAAQPAPFAPQRLGFAGALGAAPGLEEASVVWLTDGLSHGDDGALADALARADGLRMIYPLVPPVALSAPRIEEGALLISAMRTPADASQTVRIGVFGRSDVGERRLATLEAVFEGGEGVADAEVDLPLELRNQISRFAIISQESAGATALTDESVRRRRVGLTSGASEDGALRLVSNLHYLRAALSETADVVEGGIEDLLSTNPDVMALADVGRLTEPEREALTAWVEAGGMLIRFAGPRLARGADLAAADAASLSESDPLLPVNLRAGGRAVGGAMAWGAPQAIRDFNRESPFFGLTAPREVTVTRQILARLGPDLAEKTWAALEDGTPLVTSAGVGAGRVILFHVTANAEWSSLPLSGLFVDMMGRLVSMSGAGGAGELPDDAEPMRPVALMDGFGRASAAEGDLTPVAAA
ncbi:MAG: LytTR family transcriptional regulator, partial [Pseudomonadota bacterium]